VLFSTATAVNAFKRPFVEIIGQSSPFWLDYETKLRGDSQSPSLIQYLDRVLTPSSQTKSDRINMNKLHLNKLNINLVCKNSRCAL